MSVEQGSGGVDGRTVITPIIEPNLTDVGPVVFKPDTHRSAVENPAGWGSDLDNPHPIPEVTRKGSHAMNTADLTEM